MFDLPQASHVARRGWGICWAAQAAVLLVVLCVPAVVCAQTYEVLQEGFFRVGTKWEFNSNADGRNFQSSLEFTKSETVSNSATLVLTERSPDYVDSMNVYLDQSALMLVKVVSEKITSPTSQVQTTWTSPLEKIPRFVNASDNARRFGNGQAAIVVVGGGNWTLNQVQKVSFLNTETLPVPAGTFDCVVFRVDETWEYTNGYSGKAQRTYWMNHQVGFVKRSQVIEERDPNGRTYRASKATHTLRGFTSVAPDLLSNEGAFAPDLASAGEVVTVGWRERCFFTTATAHTSSVYLSTDTLINSRDALLIRARAVPVLGAGGSAIVYTSGAVPAYLPSGQYYVGVVVDVGGNVDELDESNNTFILPGQLTVTARPDLKVTAFSFSSGPAAPGDVLNARATVSNVGGAASPITWARVYLSTDSVINAATDYPLMTRIQIDPLGPQAAFPFERSATVPDSFLNGGYYAGVICDFGNGVVEADETNNTTRTASVIMIGRPDLQVVQGSFSPAQVHAGGSIAIQATIRNAGPLSAVASAVSVYLSTDTLIASNDIALPIAGQATLSCSALTSGAYLTINANPTVPKATVPGQYFVGVICDVNGAVTESDESNNAYRLPGALDVSRPPVPDLLADQVAFSPSSVRAGQSVTVNWRETCLYQNAAAHLTDVCISTDTLITNNDIVLVYAQPIPALAADQSYSAWANAVVPAALATGQYYLAVRVDRSDQVAESNETNNVLLSDQRLAVQGMPDLAPSNITFSPATLRPGAILTVGGTIRNSGGASAPSSAANVYLTLDRVVNPDTDFPLIRSLSIPALAVGAEHNFSRYASVPLGFANGGYYVAVVSDPSNAIDEADEANNTAFTSQPVMIGLPDLQVTAGWFEPVALRPGEKLSVQATIRNAGPTAAEASSASIVLSPDATISAGDIPLQVGLDCGALTSGSYVTVNAIASVSATLPLARYYVGVVCDVAGRVVEANESNNAVALGRVRVTTQPDLYVAGADFSPTTVTQGGCIALAGSIR
ncbi:hypothetical protein FJY63_04575, partial [Candidatus Sumerlaeota bacterium]|nr:hypothetical protein [Candidatus Sumerlaeota bacterium]